MAFSKIAATTLSDDIISGKTALAEAPADTDEFLISDAGTLKRIDASLIGGGGDVQPYCYGYLSLSNAFDDAVATRIPYNNAIYNVGSCLDITSNKGRFTPNVAGKYVMFASFKPNNNTIATTKYETLRFTKNGDTGSGDDYTNHVYAYELDLAGTQASNWGFHVNSWASFDMDGSSDWCEVWGTCDVSSGTTGAMGNGYCYLQIWRLIT